MTEPLKIPDNAIVWSVVQRIPINAQIVPRNDMPNEDWVLRAEAEKRIEALEEALHYANGCCDLAMKHRDTAESHIEELETKLDNARMAAAETQPSWERRCYAVLGALDGPDSWGKSPTADTDADRIEELEAELKSTKRLEKEYRVKTAGLQHQNNVKGKAIKAGLKLKRYNICSAGDMHFPLETDHGEWVKAKQLREALRGNDEQTALRDRQ